MENCFCDRQFSKSLNFAEEIQRLKAFPCIFCKKGYGKNINAKLLQLGL